MLQALPSKQEILMEYVHERKVVGKPDDIGVNGENLNSFADEEGNTLLHLAVQTNSIRSIKAILNQMKLNDKSIGIENLLKNNKGLTPLQIAIIENDFWVQYHLAQYLVKDQYHDIFAYIEKAHIDWTNGGSTPALLSLLEEGREDAAKLKLFNKILKIAPFYLNTQTNTGANIILFSLVYARDLFEEILYSPYLDPQFINARPEASFNMTCALYAAQKSDFNALELIMNHKNFDKKTLDALDARGFPILLHLLAHSNNIHMVKRLCDDGAQINFCLARSSLSPLLFTVLSVDYQKETKFPLIDYLIKHGGKFIVDENYIIENDILCAAFYNNESKLNSLIQSLPKICPCFSSFLHAVTALNNAILVSLRNGNYAIINNIKLGIDEFHENNNNHYQSLLDISGTKEFIISAKSGTNSEKTADILQEVTNAFTNQAIYKQALDKIEDLLELSIPHDIKKQLKQTTYRIVNYMDFKIPCESSGDTDIKLHNIINKTIFGILQKHGFNTNTLYYFMGFVEKNIANEIAKESLFQESIFNTSLFHGVKSHVLQFAIICVLIDLKLIDTKGYTAKDIVNVIIDHENEFEYYKIFTGKIGASLGRIKSPLTLWQYMLDSFTWYSREGCFISSPHLLNITIMNSVEEWPILSHMISRSFVRKLGLLCDIVNKDSYEQLSPEQAIYAMIASENDFSKCRFDINVEDLKRYYENKQQLNPNRDTIIEFQIDNPNAQMMAKKSHSFVEGVTMQRKRYESMISDAKRSQH